MKKCVRTDIVKSKKKEYKNKKSQIVCSNCVFNSSVKNTKHLKSSVSEAL